MSHRTVTGCLRVLACVRMCGWVLARFCVPACACVFGGLCARVPAYNCVLVHLRLGVVLASLRACVLACVGVPAYLRLGVLLGVFVYLRVGGFVCVCVCVLACRCVFVRLRACASAYLHTCCCTGTYNTPPSVEDPELRLSVHYRAHFVCSVTLPPHKSPLWSSGAHN